MMNSFYEPPALRHPEVRYEPTNKCNAECIMCPRDKHDREQGVMSTGKYKASIDEIVKLGAKRIVLTGFGEPMLDPELEEKIRYAKQAGLKTHLISNGSMITGKRAKGLIDAGLDEIRISFYGMTPETYELVMVGLKLERTMRNVLELLELIKLHDSKMHVMLNYLVLPENQADAGTFKSFWSGLASSIDIWKPHNFTDGRDYRERSAEGKRTCGRPKNGPLQIQWNGEVIPCCFDYNNTIVLGNAFEEPIPSILNGQRYKRLRNAHNLKLFHQYPTCDGCDQLLEHADAMIYSNRHDLPPAEAVKLSNTDLYDLIDAVEIQ